MPAKRPLALAAFLALLVAVVLSACGGGGSSNSASNSSPSNTLVTKTEGPNGEKPTAVSSLSLTSAQEAKLKEGGYKVALVWAANAPFTEAVQAGVEEELGNLGVEVSSVSHAEFNPAKEASDLKAALAKSPDMVISEPVEPATAATMYDEVRKAGAELVFLSTVPEGYKPGKQYVGIVTDDLYNMGAEAAEALAESLNEEGEVGMITYNIPYYVTNQRDAAFASTIKKKYPKMKIAVEAGFTNPAKVQEVAQGMIAQHPNLAGIYVSWSEPAEQVLAALRAANDSTTKVVTLDLDDTVVTDMVKEGQVVAIVVDKAFEIGTGLAKLAAYSLVGKPAPAFSVVGSLTVTPENVEQAYEESLHKSAPSTVTEALG
jgi:ribose transport system substrate-binding protein